MPDWILMVKGDEQKLVHPGNVDNHKRAGWTVKLVEQETLQASNPPEDPITDPIPAETVEAVEQMESAPEADERPKRRSKK